MPPAPTLDAAIALHQAGRRAEAEAAYAAILAEQPDHPGALHALGVLRQQQGDSAASAALIERAIARHPGDAAFHFNLGLARFRLGAFRAAAAALAEAARLNPTWPEVQYDLGNALREAGDLEGAMRAFRAALKLRGDYIEAEVNLANVLRAAGKREAAVAAYRRVLRRRPNAAEARANLAAALLDAGDIKAAAEEARAALSLNPDMHAARMTLGVALLAERESAALVPVAERLVADAPEAPQWRDMLGRALRGVREPERALAAFEAALALEPRHMLARLGRAECLRDLKRGAEAEPDLRALVAEHPDRWETWHELGSTLRELGRFADAEQVCRHGVTVAETGPNLGGLGTVLRDLGRLAESEAVLRRAVALAPRDTVVRFGLATTLLTAGKYAEGYAQYEVRHEEFRPWRPNLPAWTGQNPRGKRILVVAEQGMGDTIQFMRYLPLLARAGARAIVQVHAPMQPLMRDFPGVEDVVALKQEVPADWHVMLLSLPQMLRVVDPAPIPLPYLAARDPGAWEARLAGLARPLTGLVWAGNPVYSADHRRSVPPAELLPLAALPGTLVSLQKGGVPPAGLDLVDRTAELGDFGDTANLIAALDRVIAVDTAVAHLAGAMGKTVLMLNRFDSDWRWGMSGETTRWYPSMRIVRQPAPGDWAGAIRAAVAVLAGG